MGVRTGIISANRKLRFAVRVLLSEEENNDVDLVLEGSSIHELGGGLPDGLHPEVILLDYRQIYEDEQLYFHYLREIFPGSTIVLLVDECYHGQGVAETRHMVSQHGSARQLLAAVSDAAADKVKAQPPATRPHHVSPIGSHMPRPQVRY